MYINELIIKNFRGIKSLTWSGIPTGISALIGPGDSCKTTVLDAIGILFHSYWNLTLSENDFHDHDLTNDITIEATVVDPPSELTEDRQFLSYLRGVDINTGNIVDEPDSESPALTIRFTMDAEFEPDWRIVCDRHTEGLRISGNKRNRFGIRRIEAASGDLRWGPRSSLRAVTNSTDDHLTEHVLREAAKSARETVSKGLKQLDPSISDIYNTAKILRGASESSHFSAELNADLAAISKGSVSLHADDLPVERSGLGTRRLVSVAVESLSRSGATILLCDELEIGLEPYRTRHLVRYLKSHNQQVFMTTHSPVVLRELQASQLAILRQDTNTRGILAVKRPSSEVDQGTIRGNTEAFLAKRVAVCEGPTEIGFIRETCAELERRDPERLSITEPTSADGDTNVVRKALSFHRLGYETAIVCDNDTSHVDESKLPDGFPLLRCDDGLSIEQQVLHNATSKGCIEAVRFAVKKYDTTRVRNQLTSAGLSDVKDLDALMKGDADALTAPPGEAVATAANSKGNPWFKSITGGEFLAWLASDASLINQTKSLANYLRKLQDWCTPDVSES